MSGERAEDRHQTQTQTQPFDGAAVERLIVRLPDRYRPVRLLGHGGQGMVWLADDRELGEQVAIKILARLDGVGTERVRREVKLCRRLRHANLAEVYELVEAGDNLAVVMEHLPGGALTARLVPGPLAVAEVVRIARALLAGLAHLHDAGIVHRDVKPSNVLFAADGTAKLADFGLLRPLAGDGDLTRTGLTVGTPAYMSPEQIRGDELTAASDLYSLGVTLYELLVGRQPFVAVSSLEVAHLHLSRHPDSIRAARADCPRWLAAFVDRLLAKDPRRRWRDGRAALATFDRRRPGLSRRTRAQLLGAAAAATALAALAIGVRVVSVPSVFAASVEGGAVVARTSSGRELWRVSPPVAAVFAATGDVLPARGLEVVTAEVTDVVGVRSTELVVRDHRGAELRREPVGHQAAARWFPHLSDSYQALTPPLLADVDGDGLDDVLVALAHWPLYPSLVVLWQPADTRPSRTVLVNSGHVGDIRVHDVDGDGSPELLAAGLNNPLGMQSIAAVVDIEKSWTETHESGATSPDLTPLTANGGGGGRYLHSYTMLGESRGRAMIEAVDRGGVRLRLGTGTARLDADGNPDASPLWQRGAAPRRRFWDDCRDAQLRVATAPQSAAVLVADLEARHAAVLSDAGHRDAALFLLSGSLADAGRPAEGAQVLALAERGAETNRRLWRQRGELSLIAGRRAEARTLLEHAIAARERGANPDDELAMLALDAATNGDRAQFDLSLRVWQGSHSAQPPEGHVSLQLLEAFFAGEWNEARSGAMRWSDAFFHWQALTAWAALENGAPLAATLESLRPIAERPEARDLCLLVRGRAAMMKDDARAAADLAQQARLRLDTRARRSYESFIWQGLAHWLHGAALHDAGEAAAARADLEVAARRLPGTWLGRDAQRRLAPVAGEAVVR